MFRFLARQAYKRMTAEELIRQLAQVRLTAVIAFSGVTGSSQLNKLAEQVVQEHWDWSRSTNDPLGSSLTLTAFAHAVDAETTGLALHVSNADPSALWSVNAAISDLLERRGLIDISKTDEDMPLRLQNRIQIIEDLISEISAKALASLKGEPDKE